MQIWICEKKNQNPWFFKKLQKLYFWLAGNKQRSPSCNLIFLNPLMNPMTPPSSQMLQILKKGRCNFMFYVLHFFQFFLTELDYLQKNENFEYKLEIFWTFFSKSHYSYIYNDSLKFNFKNFPQIYCQQLSKFSWIVFVWILWLKIKN